MSIRESKPSKRPRRRKIPIQPIHVEELLAGAGMSGFLGVLDPPVPTAHLEGLVRGGSAKPARREPSEISSRVASVVLKVEALAELLKAKSRQGEARLDGPGLSLDIRSESEAKIN